MDEEFLWRPVLAGLCSYRDVNESRVSLGDIATMNDMLDVKAYNDWAAEQQRNPPEPPIVPNPFDVFRRGH